MQAFKFVREVQADCSKVHVQAVNSFQNISATRAFRSGAYRSLPPPIANPYVPLSKYQLIFCVDCGQTKFKVRLPFSWRRLENLFLPAKSQDNSFKSKSSRPNFHASITLQATSWEVGHGNLCEFVPNPSFFKTNQEISPIMVPSRRLGRSLSRSAFDTVKCTLKFEAAIAEMRAN